MVVTHGFPPGAPGPRGWAVTIGNFDGVHLGHRALLGRLAAKARQLQLGSCVLTFEPHPREYFSCRAGKEAPPRITRLRDKLERLAEAGIERVHVARFDARLASLSAEEFIEQVLARGLGARYLAIGLDFRFGKDRAGDVETLRFGGRRHAFEVEALEDVLADGARVSSSAVRAALAAGELKRAELLLGHPYCISGRVAHGAKLGRSLGFPTANLPLRRPPPLAGIYAVEDRRFGRGVASIGRRPTVNPVPTPLLEVHFFGCERELYGERLAVRFVQKLRDEEKYDDLPALQAAIARDVRRAQEYFETHG